VLQQVLQQPTVLAVSCDTKMLGLLLLITIRKKNQLNNNNHNPRRKI